MNMDRSMGKWDSWNYIYIHDYINIYIYIYIYIYIQPLLYVSKHFGVLKTPKCMLTNSNGCGMLC